MSSNQQIPIMPKATAVWLVDNTTLTFKQIADFCGMHELEVSGIADGEVAHGISGMNPITSGQLTKEEIDRCAKNPELRLRLSFSAFNNIAKQKKSKGAKYTPMARRQDKPDAIYWLLKTCPEIDDSQIAKLIGTTKSTIEAVKERSHWNIKNIRPRDPVLLGLCSQSDLDKVLHKYKLTYTTGASEFESEE
jgi:hypothetical protein